MRRSLFCLSALVILTLTGCQGAFDPTQRPGNYELTGAADETIAQQAAYKNELIQGTNEPGSDGILARNALKSLYGASAGSSQ